MKFSELAAHHEMKINKVKKHGGGVFGSLVRTVLIVGICFTILFPIIFMILSSFKTASDIYDETVVWIPRSFSFSSVASNYSDAMLLLDYWVALLGSLKYVGITTLLQVASSCFIGYGFARFKFIGNRVLFMFVILTIIMPQFTTLVPTFLNFQSFDPFGILKLFGLKPLNFSNTYWPFVLTCLTGFGFRSGLFIFIMKQFFESIPKELPEAASIDGSGTMRTFFRIMLPSATGAIITVMLFAIVWQWTDVQNTTIFLSEEAVLMKALQGIPGKFLELISTGKSFFPSNRVGADMTIIVQTGVLVVIAPVLIMYVALQKYFAESIDKTGLVE